MLSKLVECPGGVVVDDVGNHGGVAQREEGGLEGGADAHHSVHEMSFDRRPSSEVLRVPKESMEKYRQHAVWGQWEIIESIE